MEVLYHIRPYFVGIFPYIGLTYIGLICGIGTSNESVPEMAVDNPKCFIGIPRVTLPGAGSRTPPARCPRLPLRQRVGWAAQWSSLVDFIQ